MCAVLFADGDDAAERRFVGGILCAHIGKAAARERAGLVKGSGIHRGERLQIVAALDQHAALGRRAEAAEQAERHRNDQRAGAGRRERTERAINPGGETAESDQRRHDRHQRGKRADNRRINL